jgi:small subunit ribosomal protein S1
MISGSRARLTSGRCSADHTGPRRYADTNEQSDAKVVEGSGGLLLEIDGRIVPNYDATIHPFSEGDVVTGHVVRIDNDEVLVDIGYKSEGVIPSNELSIRKSVDPRDEVSIGEEVDALVLTKEDQDGRLILSKKRARFEKAWRRIEAAAQSGEPVEGSVIEVVKGGLIIDLGVRGFLPASLVDIRRVPNLDEYMGTQIECKVIELNRSRNNVVLSRRAVLEEQRKEDRERILDRLQPGQVVEGLISNIVDFGAFVDLDGIDGLIHISELSWSHVNHPSEILNIGGSASLWVSSRPRRIRGSASWIPTTSAMSSRERSPRSSHSAPSSRFSTASRAWFTSPSSPSITSRTPVRSSSRAIRCG